MARRSDHSRQEIAELAIGVADDIISRGGVNDLSVRKIATEIGYSPGTLYNVFEDVYEIIVAVASRVLDEMIAKAESELGGHQGRDGLYELAEFYVNFTAANYRRWQLVTEYQLPKGRTLPQQHMEKMNRVLAYIEHAILIYFEPAEALEQRKTAVTLWAGLHGVCSVASNSLARIPPKARNDLARIFVDNFVVGLEQRTPRQPAKAANA